MSTAKRFSKRLELWGGLECSFNRVGDLYLDQLQYNGHYNRIARDIEHVTSLGIRAMRYPVIWERLLPKEGQSPDWEGTVAMPLALLRAAGVTVIAGLMHHGSGPRYAGCLDQAFPASLSQFAAKVAERFPWIEYYTPVNEPLTTARFAGLYGFWYPHHTNDDSFARILIHEIIGVILSMQAVRKVNPTAKLVQTEDLGKVYSTVHMQYQADFENCRRWITWDLLCGKVDRHHPLWKYLTDSGIRESELDFIIANACPPDIIGVDYYATSERWLDENWSLYPPTAVGGNGSERYADVEACRVRHGQEPGIELLLRECWDRYQIPIAVAEAHLACDVDNQIRWLASIRNACLAMMERGADIRAITAWSLFGAFGWNKLLTTPNGDYECGAFDVSSGDAKATALADYLRRFSKDPFFVHPAEKEKGWWLREDRFLYEPLVSGPVFARD